MIGVKSKPAPTFSGTQYPGAMPCGTKMAAKRVGATPAVWASGVCAGIIESRRGSAKATPVPRRTARRDRCFLVMIADLLGGIFLSISQSLHVHLELFALYDAEHQRGETIIIFFGFVHDGTKCGHVVVFDATAERIGHQVFGSDADKLRRVAHQGITQTFQAIKLAAVDQEAGGIDGVSGVLGAPSADGVEIFEREADRIHDLMAGC